MPAYTACLGRRGTTACNVRADNGSSDQTPTRSQGSFLPVTPPGSSAKCCRTIAPPTRPTVPTIPPPPRSIRNRFSPFAPFPLAAAVIERPPCQQSTDSDRDHETDTELVDDVFGRTGVAGKRSEDGLDKKVVAAVKDGGGPNTL